MGESETYATYIKTTVWGIPTKDVNVFYTFLLECLVNTSTLDPPSHFSSPPM